MLRVLIVGAGIGGPALAYWLSRQRHDVTVIERAAAVRSGGQAVDFKGPTHRRVLERMGIWDAVAARQTGGTDVDIIDCHGRVKATIPAEFSGGCVEIMRGDLAELLYDLTATRCRYVFDDQVTALVDEGSSVSVDYARGPSQRFDLVVGADGIHSSIRELAFGPDERFVRHLGYYYAVTGGKAVSAAQAAVSGPRRGLMYNEPGRMCSVAGPAAPRLFVFASGVADYGRRDSTEQRAVLRAAFSGMACPFPEALAGLDDSSLHLDSIGKVVMSAYTTGRVALLGDAAYGNTLGGFGSGLAVVGAYVLAGELAVADGDHQRAFRRYDAIMHDYAKIARQGNAGVFLAPRSRWRITARDALFRNRLMLEVMLNATNRYATTDAVPDYPLEP
ncbi:MAG TPA: FAD-dependent monooxygenase [Mycobacterium sp.]|nr:FAD-dependent monooxygenase [Mycobacterium sp.]HUH69931.1 FAD-dependent monooxygenase [Mycobacterium sp.]